MLHIRELRQQVFWNLKLSVFVLTLWVNGAACAQWDPCCRLAAGSNSGRQLSPDFPSKQTKAEGGTAEPGSGPPPVGRSAGTHRGLAVLWNDSMLLMFFLRSLLSSCGRNKLLSTGSWRGSLSSTDPASTQLEPGFVHQLVNSLFGSCWGNLFSSRFQV